MAPTVLSSPPAVRPCVLVVDDEAELIELISEAVGQGADCRVVVARSVAEARLILESAPVELLVTDVHLPDGDGTSLLPFLRQRRPHAGAIVITGTPSVDGAITALRAGAVDFVLKPFAGSDLAERVRKALKRQSAAAKNERRLGKLRDAVRRLNDARKVVAKKVDLLCNDLISAYGELSRQLDVVRTQEGFKHFLADVDDLEQLLCHTMDYVMRQVGYCNIAIWLAGDDASATAQGPNPDDANFQLGAYMKFTQVGDPDLTEAMKAGLVRRVSRDGLLHLSGDEAQEKLTPAELDYLADQDVVAVNCTYLGESLAAVIVFRDAKQGFVDADVACLETISPLFAVALAGVVRAHQGDESGDESGDEFNDESHDDSNDGDEGASPEGPDFFEGDSGGDADLLDQEPQDHPNRADADPAGKKPKPNKGAKRSGGPKKTRKKNNDDWWKNGEPPPF